MIFVSFTLIIGLLTILILSRFAKTLPLETQQIKHEYFHHPTQHLNHSEVSPFPVHLWNTAKPIIAPLSASHIGLDLLWFTWLQYLYLYLIWIPNFYSEFLAFQSHPGAHIHHRWWLALVILFPRRHHRCHGRPSCDPTDHSYYQPVLSKTKSPKRRSQHSLRERLRKMMKEGRLPPWS